ncbi:MAG TPA: helicase-related protein [Anaerolineae bacterium]|nr:helicase-related protein [Anaerolineae bacterium]
MAAHRTRQPQSRWCHVYVDHGRGSSQCYISWQTGRIYGFDGRHGWRVGKGPRPMRKSVVALCKANVDWKNDPSYRWITMRNKEGGESDGKGVAVLIRVHSDGSAHVVGGAGGSLTGMTLSRLRSPQEIKVEAKRRAKQREQAHAARQEAMSAEERHQQLKHRAEVRQAVETTRAEALAEVADALGWEAKVRLPDKVAEQMDENQVARIERKRQRHLLGEVRKAVEQVQDEVIQQHNEQVAQALGDVPIDQVLTPEVDASGKGYQDTIRSLAEDNGLTEGRVKHAQWKTTDERLQTAEDLGYIKSAEKAQEAIAKLQAGAARARAEDKPFVQEGVTKPETTGATEAVREDPERAAKVLLAYQKLKAVESEAAKLERQTTQEAGLDQAVIKRGVALLENARELTDEDALQAAEEALTQRAMMQSVANLLEAVEDFEGEHGSVERHLMSARFAHLSSLYSQATGEPLPIDRRVADLLGIDAATRLAAVAMQERLGDKLDAAKGKLIQRHVQTQAAKADAAIAQAGDSIEEANGLLEGLPDLETADADDLLLIQSRNQDRVNMLQEAGQALGQALGQLEAAGHLNNALDRSGLGRTLRVSMGETGTRDVIQAARAMGLQDTEFEISADGANRFLTIDAEAAMEKLVEQTDPAIGQDYEDAQAIKRGDQDEDGWMPEGLSQRSRSDYADSVELALHRDVVPDLRGRTDEDLEFGVRDYVGRCLAEDGAGSLHEIRQRLLSPEWRASNLDEKQRDAVAEYAANLLNPKVINHGTKGPELAEKLISQATAADPTVTALDHQTINVDDHAYEALHQTLSEFPMGRVAFTPAGQLSSGDKSALRSHFYNHVMGLGDAPDAGATRKRRQELDAKLDAVVREETDLFGDTNVVRWRDTDEGKAAFAAEYEGDEVNPWEFYVTHMQGVRNAYRALQDSIRGDVCEKFAAHHGDLTGRQLQSGETLLHKADRHRIGTMSPEEYERFSGGEIGKTQRENLEAERNRVVAGSARGGRYASGSVKGRLARQAEGERKYGLQAFADETVLPKRYTLGRTAEQQLARVASHVAPNFDPKKPVSLVHDVSLSGKFAPQQRAIKLVDRMGRVGLHLSTGAGKTMCGLGSFSHLHSQGKVKRGVFVVPAKQTGQWATEATRFMEPGKFAHFSGGGKSAEERRRAYADPNTHMAFVGHQALRDDVTWAVAKHHFDGNVEKAAAALRARPPEGAKGPDLEAHEEHIHDLVQSATKAEGWDWDFSMIDEGHDALNRRGKPNSRLANALDAAMAGHKYHINATATPVKNDTSEAFDLVHKLRPDRYPLSKRDAWHRKYSGDIGGTAEAMGREVAPYFYARQVDTGVTRQPAVESVDMTPAQKARYREVHQGYLAARKAAVGTPEHTEATMKLFPPSQVAKMSDAEKTVAAARASKFLASRRDAMLSRVVYGHDESLKAEDVGGFHRIAEIAERHSTDDHDGGQLPGVVFAHNPGVVHKLQEYLAGKGYRVGVIDGTMSTEDTDTVREGFFPENEWDQFDPKGSTAKLRKAAKHDILIATDAASHGLNLQRGAWMVHVDAPYTAKTWQQRNGRIDRIGALHDQAHIYDLDHDAPVAKGRRRILERKAPITEAFQQPYELLDQDSTGTAPAIVEEREHNLGRAMHAGLSAQQPMQQAAT